MRWAYIVLGGALLAMLPFGANAEFYSGSKLKGYLEHWERKDSGIDGAVGLGYVVGVADTIENLYCPPSRVTVGQLTSMVLKQLQENPDKLHLSGDVHVIHILKKTWPCAKKTEDSGAAPAPAPATPSANRSPPKAKPKVQDASPF